MKTKVFFAFLSVLSMILALASFGAMVNYAFDDKGGKMAIMLFLSVLLMFIANYFYKKISKNG